MEADSLLSRPSPPEEERREIVAACDDFGRY